MRRPWETYPSRAARVKDPVRSRSGTEPRRRRRREASSLGAVTPEYKSTSPRTSCARTRLRRATPGRAMTTSLCVEPTRPNAPSASAKRRWPGAPSAVCKLTLLRPQGPDPRRRHLLAEEDVSGEDSSPASAASQGSATSRSERPQARPGARSPRHAWEHKGRLRGAAAAIVESEREQHAVRRRDVDPTRASRSPGRRRPASTRRGRASVPRTATLQAARRSDVDGPGAQRLDRPHETADAATVARDEQRLRRRREGYRISRWRRLPLEAAPTPGYDLPRFDRRGEPWQCARRGRDGLERLREVSAAASASATRS